MNQKIASLSEWPMDSFVGGVLHGTGCVSREAGFVGKSRIFHTVVINE